VIYAIRALGTEYVKFGYTNDVQSRLATLQTGCPWDLELVAQCEGDQATETWVHWRLFQANAHHRGEWFKDCAEVKKVLFEMLSASLKPDGVPSNVVQIERQRHKRLGAALDFAKRKKRGWTFGSKS
jgi:hypothetical protein